MRLKSVPYADGIKKGTQVKFGGLNRSIGASDGELADMRNLTGDHFPVLSPRSKRSLLDIPGNVTALYSREKLCWVSDNGFYYDNELKGMLSPGEKEIASLGDFIVIMPDKAYFNAYKDEFGSMETMWSGDSIRFENGTIFGVSASANTIRVEGVDWDGFFKAGDAVSIEGASTRSENNKTVIIREIDGDRLHFSEWAFKLAGNNGTTAYTETGELSIKRTVPDLKYMCENENRLWGCDGKEIYASSPGDIFNFNVFDGTDMDSYAVDVGSPGIFTGCTSFLGFPMFFKENVIYQVYGTLPSNFQVMSSSTQGVKAGCNRSLAISNEILFYLSDTGVVAYHGGTPHPIGLAFATERFADAAAGSDGLKYFISMREQGSPAWKLYVYDALRNMWHIEDDTQATHFTRFEGKLYYLNSSGEVWCVRDDEGATESDIEWSAEFADIVDNDPNRKGLVKLQVRLMLEPDAEVTIYMKYDSDTKWQKVFNRKTMVKRSCYIPIIPRRADHYRIKFEGVGHCEIHSLVRERYIGSELTNEGGNNE